MSWWDRIAARLFGQADSGSPTATATASPPADSARGAAAATATASPPPDSPDEEPDGPQWWALPDATLTETAPVQRPELSPEASALEGLLASHFDGHDLEVPSLPHVPQRVLQRLSDPNCTIAELARCLSEDQVVAAAVLRTCNSPMYRGLEKITALAPAVARLGSRILRTLMMHQSLRAALFHSKGGDRELANSLWRRSLAAAAVMRSLSPLTGLDPEDAFLIGLLHDIGNVMVFRVAHKQAELTRYHVDADTFEYLCHECHQEFGELVAQAWKLPRTLATLIADHHTRPGPDDPLRVERLQLELTNMILAMLDFAPPAAYDLPASVPARELGLPDRHEFIPLLSELPDRIDDVLTLA